MDASALSVEALLGIPRRRDGRSAMMGDIKAAGAD